MTAFNSVIDRVASDEAYLEETLAAAARCIIECAMMVLNGLSAARLLPLSPHCMECPPKPFPLLYITIRSN